MNEHHERGKMSVHTIFQVHVHQCQSTGLDGLSDKNVNQTLWKGSIERNKLTERLNPLFGNNIA